MWKWSCELRQWGLRRQSQRYWKCERRFGLPPNAHLSVFCDARDGERMHVGAFHVTFHIGLDHLHFYYHEAADDLWEPGGHTSADEIQRHGLSPSELRKIADVVAAAFLQAANCRLLPRS